jgi:hypothetical protein
MTTSAQQGRGEPVGPSIVTDGERKLTSYGKRKVAKNQMLKLRPARGHELLS